MWSTLWSILACKIPQFWAKLLIRTTHHTFLERSHPEVTKNPYYVLSLGWSQKKVSAHKLIDFHKMMVASLRMLFRKLKPRVLRYTKFSNEIFMNTLKVKHPIHFP